MASSRGTQKEGGSLVSALSPRLTSFPCLISPFYPASVYVLHPQACLSSHPFPSSPSHLTPLPCLRLLLTPSLPSSSSIPKPAVFVFHPRAVSVFHPMLSPSSIHMLSPSSIPMPSPSSIPMPSPSSILPSPSPLLSGVVLAALLRISQLLNLYALCTI